MVTGAEPSKDTNTLPPTWQFSLSWGRASDEERHRALSRRHSEAAKDARTSPQTTRVQRDAFLASLLLASSPPKTTRGVELADSTLRTISPRATLSPGGRCEKRLPDLAPAPRAGASIPLQARGHRRSMTPRAQCSSADPTEPGGWSARPLRSSPAARKHSSSTKSLKKPGHPIWGSVTKRQRKHYKI